MKTLLNLPRSFFGFFYGLQTASESFSLSFLFGLKTVTSGVIEKMVNLDHSYDLLMLFAMSIIPAQVSGQNLYCIFQDDSIDDADVLLKEEG